MSGRPRLLETHGCQGGAHGSNDHRWQRSIPEIRDAWESVGIPYTIENVTDAAWDMRDPVALCGCMFDLSTIDTDGIRIHLKRERMFETNWGLTAPRACDHDGIEWWAGGYVPPDKATVMALLGVEHNMTWNGLFECLPPAYTEWIGTQILAHIESEAAA